jgi:hypothetical protein
MCNIRMVSSATVKPSGMRYAPQPSVLSDPQFMPVPSSWQLSLPHNNRSMTAGVHIGLWINILGFYTKLDQNQKQQAYPTFNMLEISSWT